MQIRILKYIRYFEAVGPILLGKTDSHIDGTPRFYDQYCGLVFPGIIVELGNLVRREYDHKVKMAYEFTFNGRQYFFLNEELNEESYQSMQVSVQ